VSAAHGLGSRTTGRAVAAGPDPLLLSPDVVRGFVFLRLAVVASLSGCNLENALNADEGGTAEGTGSGSGSADDGGSESAASSGSMPTSTEPTPGDSTGAGAVECGGLQVRVATHNVRSIGAPGSDGYDALGSIVLRVDADVACFQEVQFEENAALVSLATEAGYPHAVQAYKSPAIGGNHTNACIGKVPLEVVGSWGTQELSSDFDANDTGRDVLVVRAAVGEPTGVECFLGVLTVHLKSGEMGTEDLFRRQVEVERLRQAIDRYRGLYPGDPIVVMGDFNESLDDPALGQPITSIPPDLPESFDLGNDIQLPLVYQPFASLQSEGLTLTEPTQEDTDRDQTWSDEVRLDYIWFQGATLVADEVYNSCLDDGVDEGGAMPKAGDPLPCGVSTLVSDHFAVLADLDL
jgi:endonuclease/exonuclease/phosphatase family metal-dependent hydrolase